MIIEVAWSAYFIIRMIKSPIIMTFFSWLQSFKLSKCEFKRLDESSFFDSLSQEWLRYDSDLLTTWSSSTRMGGRRFILFIQKQKVYFEYENPIRDFYLVGYKVGGIS
jgi:hypothetical protein